MCNMVLVTRIALALLVQAASTLPLPLSLGGVEVTIAGVSAPLFFVSAGQINVQVPWEVAPGVAAVVVRNPDGASSPVDVRVLPAAPGIFTLSGDGLGRGAAQSFFSREDVRINGVDSPARPNQVVTVYSPAAAASSHRRRPDRPDAANASAEM